MYTGCTSDETRAFDSSRFESSASHSASSVVIAGTERRRATRAAGAAGSTHAAADAAHSARQSERAIACT